MSEFNYQRELNKFKRCEEERSKALLDAGADPETVREICESEYELFKMRRAEARHVFYPGDAALKAVPDESPPPAEDILDEIENPLLYGALKKLSARDLSLLVDGVVNGFSQSFLAEKYSMTQSAVSRRLKTIMKKVREDTKENPELR